MENTDYQCGVAPLASTGNGCIGGWIVGGCESNPHSIPWQVAILSSRTKHCGGTLISSQHVMTAAHCTIGERTILLDL